ncbi:MAG TPA: phage minor head protein, partial [Blastocatellia bacterium]
LEIAAYQGERTARILSTAAGNVFTADGVSRDRLREILARDAIEGRTADQWWRRLESQVRLKTQRVVAESLSKGEPAEQIRQRLDELVVRPALRQAEALTRTVANNLANAASWETAEASPLTRFYRIHVTLDRRTSKVCLAIAAQNKIYQYAPDSPRPPFHFACRSIIEPIPIGRENEKPVEAGDWLKQQSKEVQDEILGPRRAEMFRKGRLQLEDLIRGDNSIAALPELRGVAASFQL